MKRMKDNRGFTLIELLAVIVILAIVMVLASSSILPFMRNAGRDAFALEANGVIDAASNAISLITVGSIDADGSYNGQPVPGNTADDKKKHFNKVTTDTATKYCFSLDYLVKFGLFDLKEASLKSDSAGKGTYEGMVEAVKNGNAYTYTVYIKNDEFMVNGIANTVDKEKDVKVSGTLTKTSCEGLS